MDVCQGSSNWAVEPARDRWYLVGSKDGKEEPFKPFDIRRGPSRLELWSSFDPVFCLLFHDSSLSEYSEPL